MLRPVTPSLQDSAFDLIITLSTKQKSSGDDRHPTSNTSFVILDITACETHSTDYSVDSTFNAERSSRWSIFLILPFLGFHPSHPVHPSEQPIRVDSNTADLDELFITKRPVLRQQLYKILGQYSGNTGVDASSRGTATSTQEAQLAIFLILSLHPRQNLANFLENMRSQSTITTGDGIKWHVEQEGQGPDVILVPDGLGECQMFDGTLTKLAAAGFRATTMDMPGMSRSASAPSATFTEVTAQKLASYVIGLMDALGIARASVWGCSSGGSTVLALALDYPSRIVNVMAHEAPTSVVASLTTDHDGIINDDAAIAQVMKEHVIPGAVGDVTLWNVMPSEVHNRLERNYGVWLRGYPRTIPHSTPFKQLRETNRTDRAPIDWSVGAATPTGAFWDNILIAGELGINFKTLPGRHYPYVTNVDDFVQYVIETTRKYV